MKSAIKTAVKLACLFGALSAHAGTERGGRLNLPPLAYEHCEALAKAVFLRAEGNWADGTYISATDNPRTLVYNTITKELVAKRYLMTDEWGMLLNNKKLLAAVKLAAPDEETHKGLAVDIGPDAKIDPQFKDVREYLVSVQLHNHLAQIDFGCDLAGVNKALIDSRSEVLKLKSCTVKNIDDIPWDVYPIQFECDGKKFAFDATVLDDKGEPMRK